MDAGTTMRVDTATLTPRPGDGLRCVVCWSPHPDWAAANLIVCWPCWNERLRLLRPRMKLETK